MTPDLFSDTRPAASRLLLVPPAPTDHRRLAQLVHLRVELDLGDDLRAPERAVLLTRIAELERELRAEGLIAPTPG